MSRQNLWTDDEMILVLDLYFKLPFGRLNRCTPEVKKLAKLIGRTDNSVALRLVNFAACDPVIIESGRHGMASGAKRCQPFWDAYCNNREELYLRAEQIKAQIKHQNIESYLNLTPEDFIGKERETVIQARVNQTTFREMVLNYYENRCAISGIDIPSLLVASHIVPWVENVNHRLNPSNGVCLSSLYDKAFDGGLITIRDDYTVQLSKELEEHSQKEYFQVFFMKIKDRPIWVPEMYAPDVDFLHYHQSTIFAPHN